MKLQYKTALEIEIHSIYFPLHLKEGLFFCFLSASQMRRLMP